MRISDWSSECALPIFFVTNEQLVGSYISADFINEETGEVIAEAGDELSESLMTTLVEAGAKEVSLLAIDQINVGAYFRHTLAVDKKTSREEALLDIYRTLRPGEPATPAPSTAKRRDGKERGDP